MFLVYAISLVCCTALTTLFGVVKRRSAYSFLERYSLKENLGYMYLLGFVPFVNVLCAVVGIIVFGFWVVCSLIEALINKIVGE